MEIDKLSFNEAVEYLAKFAGMALPQLDPIAQKQIEQKHSLVDILAKASFWFQNQLKLSINAHALEYIKKRGITDQEIKTFNLGYAPAKGLLNHLKAPEFAVEAGLAYKNDLGEYIERFRNRIIFPIKNQKNQIVGFGGRALDAQSMPKYLNSPETTLFKKNHLLYAAEIASKHAIKSERIIVVEGYIDTIFMHKVGLQETVATLGTAFNQIHLQHLWRLANEPVLCFDGDAAGKKAMLKAAHTALAILMPGLTLKFCFLPAGQDPDEIIQQYGTEYIHKLVENSMSLSEFIWQAELEQSNQGSPEGRALFEQRILDLVNQIQNPLVCNHYRKFMQNKLWESLSQFKPGKQTAKYKKVTVSNSLSIPPSKLTAMERLEYSLFAQLINYPDLVHDQIIFEDFTHFEVSNPELENLRTVFIEYHESEGEDLNNLLKDSGLDKIIQFLCGTESSFIDRISKIDNNTAKQIWLITYKKYLLELFKNEYNLIMMKLQNEDNAFEKAAELKKSMEILTNDITLEENNLIPEQF